MADLSSRLDRLSPQQRAALELRLQQKRAGQERPDRIVPHPCPPGAVWPLTSAQRRLWFLDQLSPGSAVYNLPASLVLEGPLDQAALAASLAEVAARHAALRTAFGAADGEPVQTVMPAIRLALPLVDLGGLPEALRLPEARRQADREVHRPFGLGQAPLARALLLRLEAARHAAVFVVHHIVSDGWSMSVLVREVQALYGAFSAGRPSPLLPLPVQYVDFALWEREHLAGGALARQLEYWRERLRGLPPRLELPYDRPRPALLSDRSDRGGLRMVVLPPDLGDALAGLAQREGTTLFAVLLAAFYVLLGRYTGRTDLAVGTDVAHRGHVEVEGLIGLFVNQLVLRADLGGDPPVRRLLARIQALALEAYAHQDLPFERLVEELQSGRDLSQSPLFQVAFALQNVPAASLELTGVSAAGLAVRPRTAKLDLSLLAVEAGGRLVLNAEYSTDLFEAATLDRLLAHYQAILGALAADSETRIGALPLLAEGERQQLLVEWNDTAVPYPAAAGLHGLVAAQAARTPGAAAVIHAGGSLTFGELQRRAEALARRLVALGVGPETAVAIHLERSVELLVSILAVLQAGGAYVPLDPDYPVERVAFMVEDSRARILLTRAGLAGALPDTGLTRVLVDGAQAEEAEPVGAGCPFTVEPSQPAYILYTSGSTGRPKGAVLPHGALVNYTLDMVTLLGFRPTDRTLQFASPSFDVFVEEVFPTWAAGGAVVLADPERFLAPAGLSGVLTEHGVTVVELPSAYWHEWVRELEADGWPGVPSLRLVIVGGEKPLPDRAEAWHRRMGVDLGNIYGLTETAVTSTYHLLAAGDPAPDFDLPIGRPVANTALYIVDRALRPVPIWVAGEMLIGGDGLARGFQGRPDLTAERYIPDPFASRPGARVYRSGDLVRLRPDGAIDFLGRADDQVKVRGFRVEPGEIAARLSAHPAVAEVAVVVREDAPGEKSLVAYLVPRGAAPGLDELRGFLRERLPEHMVPAAFVFLEALPLNPNGKLDRKALPAPDYQVGEESPPPRTPVEEMLAGIWREVLRLDRIGVRDDFFAVGGHSLLAAQVTSRVRAAFGVELPLRRLFEEPTIAGLARWIESRWNDAQGDASAPAVLPPPLERVNRVDRGGPLPLSFAQQRLWFLHRLMPGTAAYNVPTFVRLGGELSLPALASSLAGVASRHESLRTRFPAPEGQPVQVVDLPAEIPIPLVDLAALPIVEREAEGRRLAAAESGLPFDLQRGPLIRGQVVRLAQDDHLLLLTLHHIVSDGWSTGVLMRETAALYAAAVTGAPADLPALPVQYADYAVWQRSWLQGEALAAQLAYWNERLAGAPDLDLPTDRPRTPVASLRGAARALPLPASLSAAVDGLARRQGATLFMVLLAAWNALLARFCGQDDLVVGTAVANRGRLELEELIGFFVNTLALRTDLSDDPAFTELLGRVRSTVLGAHAHAELPFEKLVEEIHPQRDTGRNPVFQVSLVLQNREHTPEIRLPGLSLRPVEGAGGAAKFDLSLLAFESADGLLLVAEHSTDLFDGTTVQRWLEHLRELLAAAAADPSCRLSQLPLLPPEQRAQLLWEWNDTAFEMPPFALAHEPVSAQAARRPDAPAVVGAAGTLTYGELDHRSNRLASHLRQLGVGPESFVPLGVERGPDAVVGLLAILKAGGAYVPLDPGFPAERLAHAVRDCGATVAVAAPGLAHLFPDGVRVVGVEESSKDPKDSKDDKDEEGEGRAAFPESPAYAIYTSGSTGRPKGVVVSHRALVRSTAARLAVYRQPVEAYLLASSFAFDSSVAGIFWTLWQGGTLIVPTETEVIDPPRLAGWIEERRASHLLALPALYDRLLDLPDAGERLRSLRAVLVAGEACPPALPARHARQLPGAALYNEYGPTEATVWASVWSAGPTDEAVQVPIGRPIPGVRLHVLELVDGDARLAPVGIPGELWIGGEGLARGYLGRPDLAAERFRPDPWSTEPGGRLYRTGDRVRTRGDGQLDYLGRCDHQVKVRGYRIELGEVEAALASHPGVREAVAGVREDRRGASRLVAWVVPIAGSELPPTELREYLRARLPEPMVPAAFVTLERLPLTPNGKVDRRALPSPERPEAATAAAPPQGRLERALAGVWAAVLGLERVGVDDNFFDLGGHSLLLMDLQSGIRRELGREVELLDLFQYPSVRTLASFLDGRGEEVSSGRPEDRGAAVPEIGTAIAVVGLAGRFPGAADVAAFWENLRSGVESVVAFTDEELLAAGVPAEQVAAPNYVKSGVVLADIDRFDAAFFGLTPREAEVLDPQQRLFLETCWQALEDAGYDTGRTLSVGVFASSQTSSYALNVLSHPEVVSSLGSWALQQGLDKDFLPTRVSYELGLRGPSVAVQTACSSSLVALHLACQSLRQGECRMALAGGSDIKVPQRVGYLYQEGGIASPDGHCRAFDAQARGTIGGSGVAVVALKRLADALADGDTIRAVVRGSALNNDGALKVGYSAPSIEGQAEVIAAALDTAGVPADHIGYVEAHGTGTPLGDPIEVAALRRAFQGRTDRTGFCGLGSVKTNIGHLDTAAGIAGFVKTVLALEHRQIPPSLHFEAPNPQIDFAASPFYVVSRLTDWPEPAPGVPRRAGVSSFGIGGTNVHVVLEEAPAREAEPAGRAWQLLPLSARTPAALEAATERLADHLEHRPELPLADVAWTLQAGRRAFPHRRVMVATEAGDAVAVLRARDPERLLAGRWEGSRRPVAFLFPGQGAQHPDMGRGLYGEEPAFREALDDCSDRLAPRLGRDLRDLLFPSPDRREEAGRELRDTRLAQPALFAVEYALARVWLSWGVTPWAMIGHSLGEYVAACLAGVMSLADALDLVAARGELMAALPPGAMLALDLPERELRPLLSPEISLAAVNGPAACVASGPEEAVAALESALAGRGVTARRLHTSHAFHSPMMDPALGAFRERVERVELRPPSIPYLSNLTGDWITAAEATDPGYWVRHLRETVRFGEGIARLLPEQPVLLEVGPGRTLSTLVRGMAQASGVSALVVASLRHPKDAGSDAAAIVEAAGRLWLAGAEIDWRGFQAGAARRRVPLPTYPFEPHRYWLERRTGSSAPSGLVLLGGDAAADKLAGTLKKAGWTVETVATAPATREAYRELLDALADRGFEPAGVVELGATVSEAGEAGDERSLGLLVRVQGLQRRSTPAIPEAAGLEKAAQPGHGRPDLATPYEAPRSDAERRLAGIWESLLGFSQIGVHDDFFELGGHSLLATRLISLIREELDCELALETVFAAPTVARLAARLATEERQGPALPPLVPAARTAELPLSYAQQRLVFLDLLAPGDVAYNLPLGLRLRGPLALASLRRALAGLVRRHEVLRTHFRLDEDQTAFQVIAPAPSPEAVEVPCVDLSALSVLSKASAAAEARRVGVAESLRPLDLYQGPVIRALLLRLAGSGDGDHALVLTVHHVAADGWSWGILHRELLELYEADVERRAPSMETLPELPVQYADFAVWQRQWLTGEEMERQLGYWRTRLDGLPVRDLVPLDRSRPAVPSGHGAARPVHLPLAPVDSLRARCRAEEATLFMGLVAAFGVVLHHLSGSEDLVLGTDIANRTRREVEGLIGLFVNQLVLRLDLTGDPDFGELLRRVRRTTFEAYAHQDAPFDRLVERLNPARDRSRTPLFQIKLVLQNTPFDVRQPGGLVAENFDLGHQTSKFDLLLNLLEGRDGVTGTAEYSTDLFESATIDRVTGHLATVLGWVAERPEARLSELRAGLAGIDSEAAERQAGTRRSQAVRQVRRRAVAVSPAATE